jgi:HSP20 family protein
MAYRSLFPSLWRSEQSQWSPMREMNRLQRRMNRMLDEYFTESLPSIFRESNLPMEEEAYLPPCDVSETDQHYVLSFDLPGVKKEEVKIEVKDSQLIVSGQRKHESKETEAGRISHERYFGTFMRSFTLPAEVSATQVEAHFENGVLQIALPKMEITQRKQIPIREGRFLTHEKEIKPEKAA